MHPMFTKNDGQKKRRGAVKKVALNYTGGTCAYCTRAADWGVFPADAVNDLPWTMGNQEKAHHLLYTEGIGEQVCTQCLQFQSTPP